MKYYELTKEEQKLLDAVEKGEFVDVTGKEKTRLTAMVASAAKNTMERNKNINIRLSERDLLKIKSKAAEQGIPYQTLVASIIHQYNNKG